jgi:hypothetical protein
MYRCTNTRNVRHGGYRSRRPTCRLWLAVIIIRSKCTCTENTRLQKQIIRKTLPITPPLDPNPSPITTKDAPSIRLNSRFTSSCPSRSENPFANLLINQLANYPTTKDAPSIRQTPGSPHHVLPEAKTHLLIC